MSVQIIPIRLPLPLDISHLHTYLLKTGSGCFLVDTGFSNSRRKLEAELIRSGCQPGDLKLILITHGDFDHIGNAIYIRNRFSSQIAMHQGDAGILETGDMFWNRKIDNKLVKRLMETIMPFKVENRGKPDILLEDGTSLSSYGLDAMVYNTPGHSSGSICILTPQGDLFCGDLFTNSTGKPMLNSMLYDKAAGEASFERLKHFTIRTVYPGHGPAFAWEALL